MNQLREQKKQLRASIKLMLNDLSIDEKDKKSNEIFRMVEQIPQFRQANVVLAYWSMADEVCTHSFVARWAGKKTMLLPVVNGHSLELRRFTNLQCLYQTEPYGIMEPINGELMQPNQVDFAIVPGLAFDYMCHRLGRGKGFYDRLLRQLNRATKVGVGFNFQLVESVPFATHDRPVDEVVAF